MKAVSDMQEQYDACVRDVEDIVNQYLRSRNITQDQMLGTGTIATRHIFDFARNFGREEALKLGKELYGLTKKVEDKYHSQPQEIQR